MGALLAAWVVVAGLPPPPADDGAACEAFAVDAAQAPLSAPQPPDRAVVAVAAAAFGAEELRLPVPGSTPSRP